jgi:hypothetical protein
MATLTVSPAYGRDYTDSTDAVTAWLKGADFRIEGFGQYSGKYTSKRDIGQLRADGYHTVKIRYKRLTNTAYVDL